MHVSDPLTIGGGGVCAFAVLACTLMAAKRTGTRRRQLFISTSLYVMQRAPE
jgi:hypothetical protein